MEPTGKLDNIQNDIRYTRRVRRSFQSLAPLLFALFALLSVQTSYAHMHLCLDGQEPARSLHVGDLGGDRDHGRKSQGGHNDRDVDLDSPAAVKKSGNGNDIGPWLPTASLLIILLPREAGPTYEEISQVPSLKLADLFLPPLRGPPV